jgi:hypothetical protein
MRRAGKESEMKNVKATQSLARLYPQDYVTAESIGLQVGRRRKSQVHRTRQLAAALHIWNVQIANKNLGH